jgi:hypothetical protein
MARQPGASCAHIAPELVVNPNLLIRWAFGDAINWQPYTLSANHRTLLERK